MYRHLDVPMVQLSALLCLVPLALENTYLQASPPHVDWPRGTLCPWGLLRVGRSQP